MLEYDIGRLKDCVEYTSSIQKQFVYRIEAQLKALQVPEDEEGKIDFLEINAAAANISNEAGRVSELVNVLMQKFQDVESENDSIADSLGEGIFGDSLSLDEKRGLYMSNLNDYESGIISHGSTDNENSFTSDIQTKLDKINELYNRKSIDEIDNQSLDIEIGEDGTIQPASFADVIRISETNVLGGAIKGAVVSLAMSAEAALEIMKKDNPGLSNAINLYETAFDLLKMKKNSGDSADSAKMTDEEKKKIVNDFVREYATNAVVASIPIVSDILNKDEKFKYSNKVMNATDKKITEMEDSVAEKYKDTAADMKDYRFIQELSGAFLLDALTMYGGEKVAGKVGDKLTQRAEKLAKQGTITGDTAAKSVLASDVVEDVADTSKKVSNRKMDDIIEDVYQKIIKGKTDDVAQKTTKVTGDKKAWLDALFAENGMGERSVEELTTKEKSFLSNNGLLSFLEKQAGENAPATAAKAAENVAESSADDFLKILKEPIKSAKMDGAKTVTKTVKNVAESSQDDLAKVLEDVSKNKKLTGEQKAWLDALFAENGMGERSVEELTAKEKSFLSNNGLLSFLEKQAGENATATAAKTVENVAESSADDVLKVLNDPIKDAKVPKKSTTQVYQDIMDLLNGNTTKKEAMKLTEETVEKGTTKKLTAEQKNWLDALFAENGLGEKKVEELTSKEKSFLSNKGLLDFLEDEASKKSPAKTVKAVEEVADIAENSDSALATLKNKLGDNKITKGEAIKEVKNILDDEWKKLSEIFSKESIKKSGEKITLKLSNAKDSIKSVGEAAKTNLNLKGSLNNLIQGASKNAASIAAVVGATLTAGIVANNIGVDSKPKNLNDITDVADIDDKSVDKLNEKMKEMSDDMESEKETKQTETTEPVTKPKETAEIEQKKEVVKEEKKEDFDEKIFNANETTKNKELLEVLDTFNIEATDVVGEKVTRDEKGNITSVELDNGITIYKDGVVSFKQDGEEYDCTADMYILKNAFKLDEFNIQDIDELKDIDDAKFQGHRIELSNGGHLDIVSLQTNGTWQVKAVDENGNAQFGYLMDQETGELYSGYLNNHSTGGTCDSDGVYGYYSDGKRVFPDYAQAVGGDWIKMPNRGLSTDEKDTIAREGCGTTSVLQIASGLKGLNITPATAYNSTPGSLRACSHALGVDTRDTGTDKQKILEEVGNDNPVVLYLNANNEYGQHIVSVVDYNKEEDYVVILDPGSRSTQRFLSVEQFNDLSCKDSFAMLSESVDN